MCLEFCKFHGASFAYVSGARVVVERMRLSTAFFDRPGRQAQCSRKGVPHTTRPGKLELLKTGALPIVKQLEQ